MDERSKSRETMPELPLHLVIVQILVVQDKHYLLIRRSAEEDYAPNTLGLPGGKVDRAVHLDHVLEETARRELYEEIGIEAQELEYLASKAVHVRGIAVVEVFFRSRLWLGTPRIADPREVGAIQWMTAEEIRSDPQVPPWIQEIVARAERPSTNAGHE